MTKLMAFVRIKSSIQPTRMLANKTVESLKSTHSTVFSKKFLEMALEQLY